MLSADVLVMQDNPRREATLGHSRQYMNLKLSLFIPINADTSIQIFGCIFIALKLIYLSIYWVF